MLKQTKDQSDVDGKSSRRFEKLSKELQPARTDNVVPFRPRLLSRAQCSLAELEAENVALRNSAIELVLKIQDLCGRKRRHAHRFQDFSHHDVEDRKKELAVTPRFYSRPLESP
jgi:hypothetical protein